MQYAPGDSVTLDTSFISSEGNLIDVDSVTVDVYDSFNVQVITDAVPTRVSLGVYSYSFILAADAPLGLWKVVWTGMVNGQVAVGQDVLDVGDQGDFVPVEGSESRLRSRLGEVSRLPADQLGSDTLFSDSQIADLLAYAGGDLDLATLEGWKRKAAHLSRLIDISESGSDRNLSTKFKQANQMLDFWQKVVNATAGTKADAMAGRVVGRIVNLRREEPLLLTPFSGYSEHIRMYPTHRMMIPAIL